MFGPNPYGTFPGQMSPKNYYGMIVDKSKSFFAFSKDEDVLQSAMKWITENIGLIVFIEYENEVYYCSSSLLKEIITDDHLPKRMVLMASLMNMQSRDMFCLLTVLNTDQNKELTKIIDLINKKEVDIPEKTKSQLVTDILLREGLSSSSSENKDN